MHTVRIDNPDDVRYPFSQDLYDDPTVVYHGTSSCFAAAVEANGFVLGQIPFPVASVQRLVAISDSVNWKSWSRTVVKGLARHAMLDRGYDRAIYFSANYWFARGYATEVGGETVNSAMVLAAELLESTVRDRLASDDLNELVAIQTELKDLTAGAIPVVFAVRVDADWLRHPDSLERFQFRNLVETEVNIACLKSVPIDRVLAKAECVNGLNPGYMNPQPALWIDARSLGVDM